MQCQVGQPSFDDISCGYKCPPSGLCRMVNAAPATTTTAPASTTPANADTCSMITEKSACPAGACQWSAFPMMVSQEPNTCTHMAADEMTASRIIKCANFNDENSCQSSNCKWNLPKAVMPSQYPSVCTHNAADSQNTDKISMCSTIKDQ